MQRSLGVLVACLVSAGATSGQEPARFDSALPLWVYERVPDGEPRRLGTTPAGGAGIALPASGDWFVRPMLDPTVEDMTRLAAEVKAKRIPGLSLELPGGRPVELRPGALAPFKGAGLRALDMMNATGMDASAWATLGQLVTLERLELSGMGVDDTHVAALAGLTALRELYLHGASISDVGLETIGTLERLEVLGLAQNPQVNGAGLARLGGLARLRVLRLALVTALDDADVVPLASLAALEELDLSMTDLGDATLLALGKHAGLRRLFLGGTKITATGLAALAKHPRLEELDLRGCERVDDAALRHLSGVRTLRRLDVANTAVTDAGLVALQGLPLQELWLSRNEGVGDAGLRTLRTIETLEVLALGSTGVTDAGLKHLAGAPRLREVALQATAVGDGAVEHLARLPALEALDLTACEALTDAGVARLGTLTRLRRLQLARDRALTGRGLDGLARVALEELSLERCEGLEPAGFASLARLASLRRLSLAGCTIDDSKLATAAKLERLEALDLAFARGGFTDAGLAHLRGLRRLRDLDISGMKGLTPAGLAHLEGLPLEVLGVNGAWEGIEEIDFLRVVAPGLARARRRPPGPEENERQAIRSLRRIGTAQTLFLEADRDGNGVLDYAASLEQLARDLDAELVAGRRKGYGFRLVTPADRTTGFVAIATPLEPGTSGKLHFAIDPRGVVHESETPFEVGEDAQLRGGRVASPR